MDSTDGAGFDENNGTFAVVEALEFSVVVVVVDDADAGGLKENIGFDGAFTAVEEGTAGFDS